MLTLTKHLKLKKKLLIKYYPKNFPDRKPLITISLKKLFRTNLLLIKEYLRLNILNMEWIDLDLLIKLKVSLKRGH
jgi:hypothetical protein